MFVQSRRQSRPVPKEFLFLLKAQEQNEHGVLSQSILIKLLASIKVFANLRLHPHENE